LPTESFDVVLSVFAAIFAPSAEEAIGDILRVLRPGGRAFVSAWIPTGTIDAMMRAFGRAIAAATGSTSNPPFSWRDRDAVEEVAAGHGARVAAHDGEVAFVGDSPEAHFAAQEQSHPMALAMQALLERPGRIRPSARRRLRSCVGETNLPGRSVSRARIACSSSARPGRRAQPQLRTS
jgi:SAM-dependent methyltransferase